MIDFIKIQSYMQLRVASCDFVLCQIFFIDLPDSCRFSSNILHVDWVAIKIIHCHRYMAYCIILIFGLLLLLQGMDADPLCCMNLVS